ncbi:MAG: RNA 2'-phosphotransferase [Planctomycetes bacterium]|nr:RNA 2'-phosphotransferase [Planctomycetota bacterium]
MSTKRDTAKAVGSRRGKPVILTIRAQQMHEKGHEFFVTPNRVWLTDHVRPEFIEFP